MTLSRTLCRHCDFKRFVYIYVVFRCQGNSYTTGMDGKEADVINDHVFESISSSGDIIQEIESVGEILTRVELGAACSNEKSLNLNMLMMHVATKENEYEALISNEELMSKDSAEKVLEFDLLHGILDSEVNGLEVFISMLQTEIVVAHKFMVSYEDSGVDLKSVEERLQDSEELLRQSLEQVLDVKEQSSKIQWNLFKSTREYSCKILSYNYFA